MEGLLEGWRAFWILEKTRRTPLAEGVEGVVGVVGAVVVVVEAETEEGEGSRLGRWECG